MPTFEVAAELVIEHTGSDLQQPICAALLYSVSWSSSAMIESISLKPNVAHQG